MILFFGTKPGKSISKSLEQVTCPHCEQMGTLTAVSSTTFFHLFWISLFRVGSTNTISCSHCKKTYFEEEFTAEMQQQLRIQKEASIRN